MSLSATTKVMGSIPGLWVWFVFVFSFFPADSKTVVLRWNQELVVDAEIVGVSRSEEDGEVSLLSFQELSTRPRQHSADSAKEGQHVQVAVFLFDLLFLNGTSMVDCPLAERLALLDSAVSQRKKGHEVI